MGGELSAFDRGCSETGPAKLRQQIDGPLGLERPHAEARSHEALAEFGRADVTQLRKQLAKDNKLRRGDAALAGKDKNQDVAKLDRGSNRI